MIVCSRCGKNLNDKSRICVPCLEDCCADLKQQRDDLLKACDKFQEDIYQLSEGHCLLCGGKDYPVCGDKEGYEEVAAEDAEEWRLAHKEPCALIEFEAAIAKVKT